LPFTTIPLTLMLNVQKNPALTFQQFCNCI
jgi:hypothetical protein